MCVTHTGSRPTRRANNDFFFLGAAVAPRVRATGGTAGGGNLSDGPLKMMARDHLIRGGNSSQSNRMCSDHVAISGCYQMSHPGAAGVIATTRSNGDGVEASNAAL